MFQLHVPWWQLVVRSAVIYAIFFVGLRLFGKREIGQFTLFDLVLLLLVANALQPAITGPDYSISGGAIIIVTLLVINRGLVFFRRRVPLIDRLLSPQPTEIIRDGHWIADAMAREGLTTEEGMMALREHGIDRVEDVKLACLEEDGSISVVGKDSKRLPRRRKRVIRFLRA